MDKKFIIKCQKHPNKKAVYININQQDKSSEFTCDTCQIIKYQNQNSIPLVLSELLSNDQNTIFTNWPLLKNNDLLQRYCLIFEEFKINKTKTLDLIQRASNFFNSIIEKFTSQIKTIEKQITNHISTLQSEDLLKTYNEVSQRQQLLKIFSDQNNIEQNLKNLIINIEQNCEENKNILEQQYSKFQSLCVFFDEENMNTHFEKVFKILKEINDKYVSNKIDHIINNKKNQATQRVNQNDYFNDQNNNEFYSIEQLFNYENQQQNKQQQNFQCYDKNEFDQNRNKNQQNKYQKANNIKTEKQTQKTQNNRNQKYYENDKNREENKGVQEQQQQQNLKPTGSTRFKFW